ncbi:SpoIID/LytB domain-containing protein [Anaerobacillus sp. MEB173]|uniref:SpoIID/LytB domain-containing protein n=1 Tax=Anaerobacillus sp. MEB173 TaxID=3383345 RepID=UPI003F918774
MNHGSKFQDNRNSSSGNNALSENPLMKVKLINYVGNVKELSVSFSGSYRVEGAGTILPNQTYRVSNENGLIVLYNGQSKLHEGSSITFTTAEFSEKNQIRLNNRPYLGSMQFINENGFVRPINTLPVEDYLKGVIAHEMPASWAIEALKVQAVAARTYALSHGTKLIDDSINYQVYAGYVWHPNSTRAVNETAGQALHHNDNLALTVYSSSNGGQTESNSNIWGGTSLPYLPVKDDPYDPVHPWSFSFHKHQMDLSSLDMTNPDSWWVQTKEADATITNNIKAWLSRNGYPNSELKIVSVPHLTFSAQRTSGGRVTRGDITIQFLVKSLTNHTYSRNGDGSIRIHTLELKDTTASQIRSIIGINLVRTFLVDNIDDNGVSFTVSGRGFGHGVGMSQWGAKRMADLGFSYRDILQFYYPGTTIVNIQGIQPVELDREPSYHILLTVESKRATVDGTEIQLTEAPFIRNSRTLVPLRFVSEQLGSTVHWDSNTHVITINSPNRVLLLKGGSRTVSVNGTNMTIDVAPEIIRGTTFVPLRFISEQIGAQVDWNSANRTVTIKR